ncbi:SDR family oxidoreductase [Streptomyces sp. A7024]|uniref:SDR family oxidoreductase n=1 Tax=Streptomyces coryli TaxID=1128680 RepID=A0A6G4TS47_9ACTN|nr:SDR family oxidoreductase [Streptomyces coryli]NGN62674.1 SDR family oxidoreductase [Streptomyces coryli]
MRRPARKDLRGQRVFVTGAASGIGRAVALRAAAEGAELFLTDINAAGLAKAAEAVRARGGKVRRADPADVSDYDAVMTLAADIHAEFGSMDVVMNVAGISTWGTVENLEHRHWRAMVEVNLMGPIHVIEAFVPQMIVAGRGGHLVNVSSAAALIGLPWHAAYSAAKFGLRGVSEVLRFDLRRHGIGVSLVCPGAVDTPLTNTVEIVGVDQTQPAFHDFQESFRKRASTPDEVAAAILTGIRRNRYLVHTSTRVRAAYGLQRVIPPLYSLAMRVLNDAAERVLKQSSAPADPSDPADPAAPTKAGSR